MGTVWHRGQPGHGIHSRAVLVRLKASFHVDNRTRPASHLQPISRLLGAASDWEPGFWGPHEYVGGNRSCPLVSLSGDPHSGCAWVNQRQPQAKKCTPAVSNRPSAPAWLCSMGPYLLSVTHWASLARLTSPSLPPSQSSK